MKELTFVLRDASCIEEAYIKIKTWSRLQEIVETYPGVFLTFHCYEPVSNGYTHPNIVKIYKGSAHSPDDTPAISLVNGTKRWVKHGRLHRIHAPAVIYGSGIEEYWIDGRIYDYLEWKETIRLSQVFVNNNVSTTYY